MQRMTITFKDAGKKSYTFETLAIESPVAVKAVAELADKAVKQEAALKAAGIDSRVIALAAQSQSQRMTKTAILPTYLKKAYIQLNAVEMPHRKGRGKSVKPSVAVTF